MRADLMSSTAIPAGRVQTARGRVCYPLWDGDRLVELKQFSGPMTIEEYCHLDLELVEMFELHKRGMLKQEQKKEMFALMYGVTKVGGHNAVLS